MEPEVFTVDELAERWKCSAMTIYSMLQCGKLKSFKLGRSRRIPREAVERYERGEQ
jgi:excisionase family DNA binding protein